MSKPDSIWQPSLREQAVMLHALCKAGYGNWFNHSIEWGEAHQLAVASGLDRQAWYQKILEQLRINHRINGMPRRRGIAVWGFDPEPPQGFGRGAMPLGLVSAYRNRIMDTVIWGAHCASNHPTHGGYAWDVSPPWLDMDAVIPCHWMAADENPALCVVSLIRHQLAQQVSQQDRRTPLPLLRPVPYNPEV